MRILIKSRNAIERMAKNEFPKGTALISITDYILSFAELEHKPDYLLQVAFDDVDNDIFLDELGPSPTQEEKDALEKKYHMMSNDQALEIARFYFDHKDEISTIICQCEHGQ